MRGQLEALATQLVDREAYLRLATGLEEFLDRLRGSAGSAGVPERQRVLRLLVKEVLIGPSASSSATAFPPAAARRPSPKDRAE